MVRADGRLGLGQEHADEHPRLPGPSHVRANTGSTARKSPALSDDQRAMVRNQQDRVRVPELQSAAAHQRALDKVMMPLTYTAAQMSEREGRTRADELLERVGLGDRMDHEPSQLSGGQQQRVAIARSLVNHPPLLFADEPTGNLDSQTSEEVLQMFQQLNAEEGITIILVTHDANVAHHAKRTIRITRRPDRSRRIVHGDAEPALRRLPGG